MSGYRQSVEALYTAAMPQSPVLQASPVLPPSLTGTRAANRTRISVHSFQWLVTAVEVGADFFTSAAAVFIAHYARQALHLGHSAKVTLVEVAIVATTVGLLVTLLFERVSAYRGTTSLLRIRETERALKVTFLTLLFLLPVSLLAGQLLSHGMFALLAVTLPTLLLLQKWFVFLLLRSLHTRGYGVQRVVVYGRGSVARRLFTALVQSPKLGFCPVAFLDDSSARSEAPLYELGYSRRNAIDRLHTPITKETLRSLQCDTLLIDVRSLNHEAIFAAMQVADEERLQVAFLHDHFQPDVHKSESFDLDGMLLTLNTGTGHLPIYTFTKRFVDVTASALLLTLLSPLLALIAFVVRLDSPGPVFFRQDRIGKHGRQFEMFKFRSMYVGSQEYARSPVTTEDVRITRIGRFLRRTSLDELPQLINVLKGDMSLVGPRPEMPFIVQTYDAAQRQRLQVLPGITGLWQLSADRASLIHENPEYDAYYIRNRSFFLDSAILLHTLLFAMRGI